MYHVKLERRLLQRLANTLVPATQWRHSLQQTIITRQKHENVSCGYVVSK